MTVNKNKVSCNLGKNANKICQKRGKNIYLYKDVSVIFLNYF